MDAKKLARKQLYWAAKRNPLIRLKPANAEAGLSIV